MQRAVGHQHRGLSPRVRGSRVGGGRATVYIGSIPACAGEPYSGNQSRSAKSVYPRVCGGAPSASKSLSAFYGLSPRVRGSPLEELEEAHTVRSIPACAGEPWSRRRSGSGSRVYPRVCGGAALGLGNGQHLAGLSPRVRGSPCHGTRIYNERRSIPACAGEPRSPRSHAGRHGVYPRVCGGATSLPLPCDWLRGLSPRVRGSPGIPVSLAGWRGSIPACAGEPPP